MRIIAGKFKGRVLQSPVGTSLRPTTDGLRETLFNVLADRVAGARVLDAFAGTGAVGLEALSREAAHVTFVERDRRAVAVLEQNIVLCAATSASAVIRDDFIGVSRRHPRLGRFDVVFADPPYESEALEEVVTEAAALVLPGGLVVVEHSRRRASPESAGGLGRSRVLKAGDSALSFYLPTSAG